MLLRESLGISADASNRAFPSAEVDAFLARRQDDLPKNVMNVYHQYNTKHFLLAVDPSGGGSSAFAITSILQDGNGHLVVRSQCLEVAQRLPSPHLHQNTREHYHGVWSLAQVAQKSWKCEGEHSLSQILNHAAVSCVWSICFQVHCEFSFSGKCKQQAGTLALDAVCTIHLNHRLQLHSRLFACI